MLWKIANVKEHQHSPHSRDRQQPSDSKGINLKGSQLPRIWLVSFYIVFHSSVMETVSPPFRQTLAVIVPMLFSYILHIAG